MTKILAHKNLTTTDLTTSKLCVVYLFFYYVNLSDLNSVILIVGLFLNIVMNRQYYVLYVNYLFLFYLNLSPTILILFAHSSIMKSLISELNVFLNSKFDRKVLHCFTEYFYESRT
jgi:hypothetical protein